MNKVEEITKCKEMLDNGLITPEEFNEMKSAIINNTDKDAVSKRNEESLNTNITRKKTRSINKDSIVNKIKDKKNTIIPLCGILVLLVLVMVCCGGNGLNKVEDKYESDSRFTFLHDGSRVSSVMFQTEDQTEFLELANDVFNILGFSRDDYVKAYEEQENKNSQVVVKGYIVDAWGGGRNPTCYITKE